MAVLDYSILGQFSTFFIWLLLFFVAYGLLRMTDMFKFGSDSGLYALIAIVLALLLILSDFFVTMMSFSLPWLTVLVVLGFFMLFFTKMFAPGVDAKAIISDDTVKSLFIAFTVIIFLFGMSNAIGQDVLDAQTGVDSSQLSDSERASGETMPADTFVPAQSSESTQARRAGATTDRKTNVINTFFHPNVLGTMFLLIVAMMTIFLITRDITK